jgi:hypothetical protein
MDLDDDSIDMCILRIKNVQTDFEEKDLGKK